VIRNGFPARARRRSSGLRVTADSPQRLLQKRQSFFPFIRHASEDRIIFDFLIRKNSGILITAKQTIV
jgi:hypothetical protein